MQAIVKAIRHLQCTEVGTEYQLHVEVDGVDKEFLITALKGQNGDVTWDNNFDHQFLSDHVDLGIAIMHCVGKIYCGIKMSLPQVFSD